MGDGNLAHTWSHLSALGSSSCGAIVERAAREPIRSSGT